MSGTTPGRRVYLAEGREFPSWTITSHVADGALSSVYRARYTGLRVNEYPAEAALKITSLLPADRERLVEEYETARRFSGHPQVVQVYDVFETDTTEYGRCVVLVHELGEESLKDYLGKFGALTRLELQRLADNMASGIAALHDAKIIHSDIKPANILSFQSGWKVADLGAAAVINSQATNSSVTSADYYAGTLAYATPEHAQALHEGRVPPPVHRNADTWAFGVVLHEAATGVHPFQSTAALIAGTPTIDPSLTPETAEVVTSCLSPSEFRPRDGHALLALLGRSSGTQGIQPEPADPPQVDSTVAVPAVVPSDENPVVPSGSPAASAAGSYRRWYYLWPAVLALLVVGGVVLWSQTRGADDDLSEELTTSTEQVDATAETEQSDDTEQGDDTQHDSSASTTETSLATIIESNPGIRGAVAAGSIALSGTVPSLDDERLLVDLMESVVGPGNVESDIVIDANAPQPEDLSLDIVDEIQFAVGSSNIAPEFLPTLDQIVALMKLDPNLTAIVKGHTDSTGDKVENLALSQRRAEAIVEYVATQGINRFRLEPQGRGSTEPVASEGTTEGRRQNRRIEFALQGLRLTP